MKRKNKKRIKIILTILALIFVVFFVLIPAIFEFLITYSKTDEVVVKMEKDDLEYIYSENFPDGKTWRLYINDDYTGERIAPFEDWTHMKMRKHLSNKKLIKTIIDVGDVRVYALPLYQYESKYEFFYTVDGKEFFEWNKEDILYIEEETGGENFQETKQRLEKLYQYISEDELKKVSEESWE